MSEKSPFVVSPDWLVAHLSDPDLSIVDGSWYLPAQNRNGQSEYDAEHIPGAVFFDHDRVVEPGTGLPHSLPSAEIFGRHASTMGISRDDTIVVYDGPGFFSAPRTRWLFSVMGAEKVFVLDGGFDRWKADGRNTTDTPTKITPATFTPKFDGVQVVSLSEMRSIVDSGSRQIADARPAGRFTGVDPEPRAGIRSGHMPGAHTVSALELSSDGSLLPLDQLREKIHNAGIDLEEPVVTTCGSGITAAVVALALHSLGHTDTRLYDGSWSEWAGLDDTPVVTGD